VKNTRLKKNSSLLVAGSSLRSRTSLEMLQIVHDLVAKKILWGMWLGDLVADYLEMIGIVQSEEFTWTFPLWFYHDLGLALQIAFWERVGIVRLLADRLPSSSALIDKVFEDAKNRDTFLTKQPDLELGKRLEILFIRHLAHFQPSGLRTEFYLDKPDPDALVEAMAQFLVRTRHKNNSD
jgi:hypothetical protein